MGNEIAENNHTKQKPSIDGVVFLNRMLSTWWDEAFASNLRGAAYQNKITFLDFVDTRNRILLNINAAQLRSRIRQIGLTVSPTVRMDG